MKKFYFFAAAMLLGLGASAQTDLSLTPDRFKFDTQEEGQFLINWYNSGVNPAIGLQQAIDGADAGFLALCLNPAGATTGTEPGTEFSAAMQANTKIVDLGGTAGKVLLMKGYSCETAIGPDATAPETVPSWWGNYSFYSKVSGPTEPGTVVRVRMVYNIVSDVEWSYDAIAKIEMSSNQNATLAFGDGEGYKGYFSPDLFYTNEDEGTNDLTKWGVIEYDVTVGELNGFPIRTRYTLTAATYPDACFLLKEISYTMNPSGEAEEFGYVNYTVGGSSSVESVLEKSEASYAVNGNQVSFVKAGNVYNISGMQIADATAGETITLDRGIYVVKAGDKAEKLIIK